MKAKISDDLDQDDIDTAKPLWRCFVLFLKGGAAEQRDPATGRAVFRACYFYRLHHAIGDGFVECCEWGLDS